MNHPSIIKLVGIILRPKAMLLMEYAELGSLNALSPYSSVSNNLKHRIAMQVMYMYTCYGSLYASKHFSCIICIPPSISIYQKDCMPGYAYVVFFFQVASGLAFLHKNKVIYRDLKPGNILIFSLSFNAKVSGCCKKYDFSVH